MKSWRAIPTDSQKDLCEFLCRKKYSEDTIGVHIGCTILGLSKLKLLTTLYSFTEHLSVSHIRLLYIDTDSIYLALCTRELKQLISDDFSNNSHDIEKRCKNVSRAKLNWKSFKKDVFVNSPSESVSSIFVLFYI